MYVGVNLTKRGEEVKTNDYFFSLTWGKKNLFVCEATMFYTSRNSDILDKSKR